MIRKIASVTALAIATVPMIALTANMVSANSSPSKITIFNQGGYVADYQISYNHNGVLQKRTLRNLRLGHKRTVTLPSGSIAVWVKGQVHTGLLWEPKKSIFNQFFRSAPSEVCFKTYGTTLAAQWDNQCRADF